MKKGRLLLRSWAVKTLDFFGRFRLLTMYAGIIILAAALFGISLTVSNRIARDMIRADYREYNDTIFDQTETELNRQIEDLAQLSYTVMSNKTLVDFVEGSSFIGRTEQMDAVKAEFDRLIAIQQDIRAISLYQLDGKMIASTGIKSYMHDAPKALDSIRFSGLIRVEGSDYFAVDIPLFNVDTSRNVRKAGACSFLMSMDYLTKSLMETLPGSEYFLLCADADGKPMIERGALPETISELLQAHSDRNTEKEGQVVYQATLERSGWRILFGVPSRELFANINRLQRHYFITYLIIGLLLLVLFVMIYASVIRPIHRQIRFMNYYTRNRESRIEVNEKNEMGELARNLNGMLDDIEQLTAQNMEAQNRLLEAEYRKKQSELLAYRSQINPHFLYNTLECIRGMALYHDVNEIAVMTEALSRMFSYNLKGKGYAPVQEVKTMIEDYASIIHYRFRNRFGIEVQIDADAADVPFPKMVVQPLVENAIFHGLETIETGGKVRTEAHRNGGRMTVIVEDNGLGMTEEELQSLKDGLTEFDRTNELPDRSHGIGLLNVYRRLRLFYGDSLEFTVDSAAGKGTRIQITVPCEIKDLMEKENASDYFGG